MDVPIRERAADDPVVVFRVSLRRHHGLTAPRRTAFEVGILRSARVELFDELFRFHRQFVHRAIREVHDLFRMAEREHAVGTVDRRVARVGRRRGVPEAQRDLHVAVPLNRSGEPAVADDQQLAVPVVGRHPELDVDVGITRRLQHHRDAAVPRNRFGWRRRRATLADTCRRSGRHEGSGLDDDGRGNAGLSKWHGPQALTRRCADGCHQKRRAQNSKHVILLDIGADSLRRVILARARHTR